MSGAGLLRVGASFDFWHGLAKLLRGPRSNPGTARMASRALACARAISSSPGSRQCRLSAAKEFPAPGRNTARSRAKGGQQSRNESAEILHRQFRDIAPWQQLRLRKTW